MRGAPYDIEHRIVVGGALKWVRERAQVEFDKDGRAVEGIGTVQDITERKRAQEELLRINRAHRALSSCNEALIRATEESAWLDQVCRIIVDKAGYRFCWVGRAEHDEAKTVTAVAQAGVDEGYLKTINVTWADTERGRGPTGTCIRTGQTQIVKRHRNRSEVRPVAGRGAEARVRLDHRDSARRRRRTLRSAEHLRGGGRSVPRRRSDAVDRVGRRPGLRRHHASRPSRATARGGGDSHAECRARGARPRTNRRPRSRPRSGGEDGVQNPADAACSRNRPRTFPDCRWRR